MAEDTRISRYTQAIELLQNGHITEAHRLLEELLEDNPANPEILAAIGTAEGMLGNFHTAERILKESIALNNNLPGSHYSLGRAQQAQGNLSAAAESFTEACKLQPGIAVFHMSLGKTLDHLGCHEQAVATYQRALSLKPDSADAAVSLGNALIRLDRPDTALPMFDRAINLQPDNAGAITGKAVVQNKLATDAAATNLVTVLIPAYNCENSIRETIDSCLNQIFDKINIIIINDCSTDDTLNIISGFSDKRVTTVNLKKNIGKASALNRAIDVVTTPYISFIDADDYYKLDFLEKATTFMEKFHEFDMVYTDYETLTPDGKITTKKALPQIDYYNSLKSALQKDPMALNPTYKVLSDKGFIPACSAIIKREVFNNVRFDEKCFIEDIDLWCQIAGKRFNIKYLPITSYVHRTGFPNQKMSRKKKMRESHDYILKKLKTGRYF